MTTPTSTVEGDPAVQQELDLKDLCSQCGKPHDDCCCVAFEAETHEVGTEPPGRPEWVCPYCLHQNTTLNRYCGECGELYGVGP